MNDFFQLKKNLKNDFSKLELIKIAVLADSATQFLTQALRGSGFNFGFNLNILEADFNQIERQVFDSQSELYAFKPELILIYHSSQKLLEKYNGLRPEDYTYLAENQSETIKQLHSSINELSNSRIIYYNYTEIDDAVFGNYANKIESSFIYQIRKLNYELMKYAGQHANFYICDIASVQNQYGKATFFQPSVYVNTDMILSIEILPIIAYRTINLISALQGRIKKCLIMDLDNTIWGGVIGEDGLENIQIGSLGIGKAFTELQHWIKKLKNRGIILAVCSKNTESLAKEPFENHPDMILRLEDIAVFKANWENKILNIKRIQGILNINFDSIVFLDDNPFERNMVREFLPAINVPELPDDPANYLEYLYSLNLFETASISEEDIQRTKHYQTETKRISIKDSYDNEDAFLRSLNMISLIEPFNKFNSPRIAQLSQRSNQFNLRSIRYTENDINALTNSANAITFSYTLEDKFGENGTIGAIILKKETADTLFIDSWFMSCRVLNRGMEQFTLNSIVRFAVDNGYKFLKGEYIKTKKNEMVEGHFKNLGFEEKGKYWILETFSYETKLTHVKLKA